MPRRCSIRTPFARRLTEAGIDPTHADALTDAIREAAEHHQAADFVTVAHLDTRVADLDARIAALEARIYRAMLLQAGVIIGAIVAILRFAG